MCLPEDLALLERRVNICVPAAGRLGRGGFGGPQRPQVWALGLQVTVGHLRASCRSGRFHSWESWPGQVVCSKEGVQRYPFFGNPKLSSVNPLFISGISCGEAGSLAPWYLGIRALEGGYIIRKVGPKCRNSWYEVYPASRYLFAKCSLFSADFCCPVSIPLSSLEIASCFSFGETLDHMIRVGLTSAPWFQEWACD